jgi:beta-ribofuranosylaminobenzene 5'-phosphate synthase
MKNILFTLHAYPRLHFGLTDLSGATPRAYGGLGVALNALPVKVEAARSLSFELNLETIDADARKSITQALSRASKSTLPLSGKFVITDHISNHVGLGSTTATTMAVLQSIAITNSWPLKPHELVELSGRGRTSAVGSRTFFGGGLVVDAGQPAHPVSTYLPSLQPSGRLPSTVLGRWDMPDEWVIHLLFNTEAPSVPPEEESSFFATAAPTSKIDTLHQLASLYHGMLPAILEEDLEAFAGSLKDFQLRGFKAREIEAQAEHVQETLRRLWDSGIAAGLSSFGPTVFTIERLEESKVRKIIPDETLITGPFCFRKSGFEKIP